MSVSHLSSLPERKHTTAGSPPLQLQQKQTRTCARMCGDIVQSVMLCLFFVFTQKKIIKLCTDTENSRNEHV